MQLLAPQEELDHRSRACKTAVAAAAAPPDSAVQQTSEERLVKVEITSLPTLFLLCPLSLSTPILTGLLPSPLLPAPSLLTLSVLPLCSKMIADIDTDGSGHIDFDEFLDMMTAKMVGYRYLGAGQGRPWEGRGGERREGVYGAAEVDGVHVCLLLEGALSLLSQLPSTTTASVTRCRSARCIPVC